MKKRFALLCLTGLAFTGCRVDEDSWKRDLVGADMNVQIGEWTDYKAEVERLCDVDEYKLWGEIVWNMWDPNRSSTGWTPDDLRVGSEYACPGRVGDFEEAIDMFDRAGNPEPLLGS